MKLAKVVVIVVLLFLIPPILIILIVVPVRVAIDQFESGLEVGWLLWVGGVAGGWLLGLMLLFFIGTLLSKLTLKAVERARFADQFAVGKSERLLRWVYRIVIAVASVYFYVSVLILILIIVSVIVLAFLLWAQTYGWLFFLIILPISSYVLYHLVRGVLIWIRGGTEFGLPVTREQAPELWAVVEEVASRVGTHSVDVICLTAAPEVFVIEDGSLLEKLRDLGQRRLVIGLGLLPGMVQTQLEVILAHEYGHFVGRDTVGNVLERHVSFSMDQLARRLIVKGLARWYNPVWLFLCLFQRVFRRITLGASRLREILADRCAAMAYGIQNCVDALTHTVRQSAAFSIRMSYEIKVLFGVMQHASSRWRMQNLYAKPPLTGSLLEQLEAKVEEEMKRSTSFYDSHLSTKERIELIRQLGATEAVRNEKPVWDLLPEVEELQDIMTAAIQNDVTRWRERSVIWLPRRRSI